MLDVKRIIGLLFSDQLLQLDMAGFSFNVVKKDRGQLLLCVAHNGTEIDLSPEHISTMLLLEMKAVAERATS